MITQAYIVIIFLSFGLILLIFSLKTNRNLTNLQWFMASIILLLGTISGTVAYIYFMGEWESSLWNRMMGPRI